MIFEFQQQHRLNGHRTVAIDNNVETLACLPHIINRGVEWFKSRLI